tara:strand:- start:809 stop:2599 length:1791 start_codon:yes stop_codon:yes gene_type:complete
MADKTVKITFEIDGLQQSVTNIDDAKVALEQLETQAKQTGDAADTAAGDFDKLGDASKDAGEAGEGAIAVLDEATGGLASRFKNVITGVGKMGKAMKASFKAGVKGASSLKTALVATGIGALVVALGLIVAYWDDIVGLVSGVTSEQKKLNAEVEANVTKQQEALDAISLQENSLRLQGKSEKEIRDIKREQTNEVIAATEAQLFQMQKTKEAQVAAAQRNKDITQGIIRFLTLPITMLLATVDSLTKALSMIPGIDISTNLEEGFSGGIAGLIFDPEEVATEGDAAIAEVDAQLAKLKSTRDGYLVQDQKDAKAASDKRKADAEKEAADLQAIADKAAADKKAADEKAAAEAEVARLKKIADAQTVADMLLQADLDLIQSAYDRAQAELEIQREADIAKITAAGATAEEIARINTRYDNQSKKLEQENSDFKKALSAQDVDNALAAGSQILGSITSLLGEGSKAASIAAQGQNAIDTYASATAAYKSVVGIPVVGPVLAPIAAGVAVAAGIKNAKAIAAVKTPGSNVPAPNISVPTGTQFAPPTGGETVEAGNNVVTPDGPGTVNNQPVIKAYVISSDVTSQQEADAKINDLARL